MSSARANVWSVAGIGYRGRRICAQIVRKQAPAKIYNPSRRVVEIVAARVDVEREFINWLIKYLLLMTEGYLEERIRSKFF